MSDVRKKLFRVLSLFLLVFVFIYFTYSFGNFEPLKQIYYENIMPILKTQSYLTYSYDKRKEDVLSGETKKEEKFDFHGYPCLMDYSSPNLQRLGRCIRTVNVSLFSKAVTNSKCVKYKNAQNTPICIYDREEDKVVSGSLLSNGEWEGNLVNVFGQAIEKAKVTDVLDLGCNVGAYTLKAATLGKHVVAVDANIRNLQLLSRSLVLGELTNKVTLINNAVSDVYTNVSLTQPPKNIGGNRIHLTGENATRSGSLIETIYLDDLEDLFHNKRVAIKMDIEGSELVAFRGGKSFLKNIDIRFIQMEIGFHIVQHSGAQIVKLLDNYGFVPYRSCSFVRDLMNVSVRQWPWDVCFKKQSTVNNFT